ncbi:putative ABC transport system ATP-binding protein [Neomicrococcus aestuarii]|uniref:Putative ABC transport system ATP-binding protein n=1 Tax=Neomicrococcus aestuarii TaxID=556325 RepID=A0A7W8WXJ5_9MICC|nr:ABC transporter ATP-binding protein [Neomicrococcus aestuarii]MBB5511341.1 putative ABC transport system ATP-binding protein [Neomicrococcus aestuarii]
MNEAPAVSAHRLSKTYGSGENTVHALREVSLDIAHGSFVAIMGPSGSGKSTLMHCLAGLDTASAGEIFIEGRLITGMKDTELTELRRRRVGFVFQAFNLVPTLNARQNIELPFLLDSKKPNAQRLNEITAMLGLQERLSHKPHELSGGQQQRVAIARALVTEPAVLFADEPTGNLDSTSGRSVLGFLRSSADAGQTIIMVTHDPAAASYADKVLVMRDGSLVDSIEHPTVQSVTGALAEVGA